MVLLSQPNDGVGKLLVLSNYCLPSATIDCCEVWLQQRRRRHRRVDYVSSVAALSLLLLPRCSIARDKSKFIGLSHGGGW